MEDYEIKYKENEKNNEKYLEIFKEWLENKKLGQKTINKHLSNVDFYINEYLNYRYACKMEDGIIQISEFLGYYFIEKCAWSSKTSIKDNAASIKKFYQCMNEKGYVVADKYNLLCSIIKDEMEEWLDKMDEYDDYLFNGDDDEDFLW